MPNPPRTALVAVALLSVYLVWGSTYVAIRIAVRPFRRSCWRGARFLVAGAVLYAWAVRRGDAAADPIGPAQWAAATRAQRPGVHLRLR